MYGPWSNVAREEWPELEEQDGDGQKGRARGSVPGDHGGRHVSSRRAGGTGHVRGGGVMHVVAGEAGEGTADTAVG